MLSSLLAAYPCRVPSDFGLVRRAYMQALEGVCQWALFEAERRINQGSLRHGFMPSPSELRGEINQVMEPIRRAAEETRRYNWPEERSPQPDEAARARMRERYRQLCRWREANIPDSPRANPSPPRPPRQIPDYSEEPVEITAALRRTLEANESFAAPQIENEQSQRQSRRREERRRV